MGMGWGRAGAGLVGQEGKGVGFLVYPALPGISVFSTPLKQGDGVNSPALAAGEVERRRSLQPALSRGDRAGGESGYKISSSPNLKPVRLHCLQSTVSPPPLRRQAAMPPPAGLVCWRFNELCARL